MLRIAGQCALLAAAIGIVGLVLLFTFFAVGGPFGTANDIVAILGFVILLPVGAALLRIGRGEAPASSLLAFAILLVGVGAGVGLQVALVSGVMPFEEQLPLVLAAGALLGVWYALGTYLARGVVPRGLVRLGFATGGLFVGSVAIFWTGFLLQGVTLGGFADADAFARLHPLVGLGFGLALVSYLVSPAWAWWIGRVFLRALRDAAGEPSVAAER